MVVLVATMAAGAKEALDFAALALRDSDFASVVGPTGWVDLKNPKAVQ